MADNAAPTGLFFKGTSKLTLNESGSTFQGDKRMAKLLFLSANQFSTNCLQQWRPGRRGQPALPTHPWRAGAAADAAPAVADRVPALGEPCAPPLYAPGVGRKALACFPVPDPVPWWGCVCSKLGMEVQAAFHSPLGPGSVRESTSWLLV
eukprot:765798-Pelagomonas_calceolata.AAC.2